MTELGLFATPLLFIFEGESHTHDLNSEHFAIQKIKSTNIDLGAKPHLGKTPLLFLPPGGRPPPKRRSAA